MLRIVRHYHSASALLLFFVEAVLAGAAACGAYYSLLGTDAFDGVGNAAKIAAFVGQGLLIATIMYSVGLYERPNRNDLGKVGVRLGVCLVIAIPILILASEYIAALNFKTSSQRSVFYLLLTVGVVVIVVASRLIYRTFAQVASVPHRILVVGVGSYAAEICRLATDRRNTDDVVVGYYNLKDEVVRVSANTILPSNTPLLDTIRANGVKELVIALDDRRGAPLRALLDARMAGITVTSYLSFWERETRRINLANLEPGWLIYSDGFRISSLTNAMLKRCLDIGASLFLLTLSLPVLLVAAIAIRLGSGGGILYSQERVGRNGAVFQIYKLRTMRANAEQGVPTWATARDPRITRVGAFLRLTRIDELPQLYNVLKGDMSVIGPRPERPFFVEDLTRQIPYYSERHRVRPGITGWAQINYPYGASIDDAKEKLSYDLYYIKNFSMLFDVLILLATIQTVLWNKGAR